MHGGGFLNRNSNGNYRIQLHVYSKLYPWSLSENNDCRGYTFDNFKAEQLNLYYFEKEKKEY